MNLKVPASLALAFSFLVFLLSVTSTAGAQGGKCLYVTDRSGVKLPCDEPPPQPPPRRRTEPDAIIWLPEPDPKVVAAGRQFEVGKRSFQSQDWLGAVRSFELTVENAPENREYRLWLESSREHLKAWQLVEAERLERIRLEQIANRETPHVLKDSRSEVAEDVLRPSVQTEDARSVLKSGLGVSPQKLAAERAAIRRSMALTIASIRRIGFARTNADLMAWDALSEKARKDFEAKLRDGLIDAAMGGARTRLIQRFRTFDQAKAARVIRWLKSHKWLRTPDWLTKSIERVGKAKFKGQVAKDAEDILDHIEGIHENADKMELTYEDAADLAVDILEGLLNDPRSAILVAELKIVSAAFYNSATQWVSRHEINRLNRLSDTQLRNLKWATKSLKKDAAKLRKLERDSR